MIIQPKTLKRVLFLDIETVSIQPKFEDLKSEMQYLWALKAQQFIKDKTEKVSQEVIAKLYQEKAGIFAEFGKIVCISIGYLSENTAGQYSLRLKSFHGDEKDILKSFCEVLDEHYYRLDQDYLCGHNLKEFDIPFTCRRCITNGISLPTLLNISGKKPWQLNHLLDTMEMWRFGDYKNYTSLVLLAGALGVPSPKDDIDGSMVGEVYWKENDIERIVHYCEKDVTTVVQIAMRFSGIDLIPADAIEIA